MGLNSGFKGLNNYHSTLRNTAEERRSPSYRDGSIKPPTVWIYLTTPCKFTVHQLFFSVSGKKEKKNGNFMT